MRSLRTITENIEEWDTFKMVKVITDRKNELLELENKKNEEVTDELEYLLSLSKDLEEDD
mgnify:CR=1 FL=1